MGYDTVSITATDACRVILGFLDIAFGAALRLEPFVLGADPLSLKGIADCERSRGGADGSEPPGDGIRRGRTEASSDCVNWCELRELLEIVDALAWVGVPRLCV